MSNYKPLFIGLVLLFSFFVILFSLGDFIDVSEANPDSVLASSSMYSFMLSYLNSSFVDFIYIPLGESNGTELTCSTWDYIVGMINIGGVFGVGGCSTHSFLSTWEIPIPIMNPFALFGTTFKTYLINSINALTYVPTLLLIPFFALFTLGIIWTFTKLILP